MRRRVSRLRALRERALDRLARSAHVFLAGLVVACGIEVAVDWNATLYEINVLRDALRQKGENYASILRKATEGATLSYDWDELDRLSGQVFDDPDVVYLRFSDMLGNVIHDRLRPEYARDFYKRRKQGFRTHYRHVMERDVHGMLEDPLRLQERLNQSRHRDFIQVFNDRRAALVRWITREPPPPGPPPRTLYQDRLADPGTGRLDRGLSYALGTITSEQGEPFGVVLIAFRDDGLNRAILGKLANGLAITLFFVGLIVVQNVMARRAKLRLLALEEAQGAARAAVRAGLPAPPALPWADVHLAFAQAEHAGGTIYDLREVDGGLDLLLAVPQGSGVEAAFAAVVLADLHRRLGGLGGADPVEQAIALLADYAASPHARPVSLLLARFAAGGQVRGLSAGLPPPAVLADGAAQPLELGEALAPGSALLCAPLRPFAGAVPPGAAVAVASDRAAELWAGLAAGTEDAAGRAEAAIAAALRRHKKKLPDDLFVLVLKF